MKKAEILRFIFIFGIILLFSGILVFAEDNSARIKLWDVNQMPTGTISNYDELTIIQADKGKKEVTVNNLSGKRYRDLFFTKCINTNGEADVSANYVPSNRAIKFTVNQPCALVMYAFDKSSKSGTVKLVVSRKGAVEAEFSLNSFSFINRYFVYLENPGDYYIYNKFGSMGISTIELNKIVKGDLNGDGKVTEEDVVILLKSFNGIVTLNNMQKKNADMDNNGTTDENDKNLMLQNIKSTYGYLPQFTSNKVWSMENLYSQNFKFEKGKYYEFDGLGVVSGSYMNFATHSNNKKYYEMTFSKYMHIGGNADSKMTNYYPLERAIKVNIDKACYLTYYAASTSTDVKSPCIAVSRDGQLIKKTNLEKPDWEEGSKIQKHTVYLPEPDSYYIYSSGSESESINIYQIELTDANSAAEEFYKTVSVVKNNIYDYKLTADNVSQKNNIVYRIVYDTNYIRLSKLADIEFNQINGMPVKNESDLVQIIYAKTGVVKFKFKENVKNWSGVLSDISFKAVNDGNTTIKFETE